jgi:hypothetical protein
MQVENRRRSGDLFDQFFNDPFFKQYTTQKYKVKSDPVKVTVLSLPAEDVPSIFKGAVGRFTMNTSLGKSEVQTGEPISLKVTLSGTGNIKLLESPAIAIPTDFEKYDPKVTDNIIRQNNTVSGSKTFEYLMIPRHPGVQKIPPIEFAYFDLGKRGYVTLKSPEYSIDVSRGTNDITPSFSGISREDVRLLAQDIRYIKGGDAGLKKRGEHFYQKSAFMILTLLPLAMLVGIVLYRQRMDRRRGDVITLKMRRANRLAIKRMASSKGLLDKGKSEEFYAEVSRALWGYLGDKLNVPPAEITLDVVISKLKEKYVPDLIIERIRGCVEACDYARFTPSSSTPEEMGRIYQESRESIVQVERIMRG